MNIELFEKYLHGLCTAEEQQQVEALLEKDPGLMEAWLKKAATEPVTEPMPAAMETHLLQHFRTPVATQTGKRTRMRKLWVWTAAAAAVLVAGICMLPSLVTTFTPHEYVVLDASSQVQKVTLPDQSVVWLKPGARLRYDRNEFGRKDRVITLLQGESYFEVVHNAGRPFIVESGEVQTTDIGTAFSVRNDSAQVWVTVASGEVAVSHDHHLLSHLRPGAQVAVVNKDGQFVRNSQPLWMAAVWKENELQLTGVSFQELSLAVQQFYHVQLQTGNQGIRQQTYTIQLKRQMPVGAVVSTICMLNQNQFKQQANGNYLVY